MKVLMISGDKNILIQGSEAYARFQVQKRQVEQLDAFVWPQVQRVHTIMKAAKANHYNVVTAQDPFWRGLVAWRIARRTRAKLNLQIHTDLSAQPFWRLSLASFLIRRANSVRVVSENIRKQVKDICYSVPVHVLPIFVDVQSFRALHHTPHPQKTILWIGRFEPEKDPLSAVRVLKDVRAKGIDVKLIMLGTGSLESTVRRFSKTLPIEFPGWHDPKPYLEMADVVLSTSQHESWGASIVESLAAGVPVVAPDVGIAREAGAFVVDRAGLSSKVVEVIQQEIRGALLLRLPDEQEWAHLWEETL